MSAPEPYAIVPSLAFDDLPGALPGDVVPADVNLERFSELAKEVLENFGEGCLTNDAIWRDFFAVTSRVRTFYGDKSISQEWKSRATRRPPTDFQTQPARISRLAQNSNWVDVVFTFVVEQEGGLIGDCFGILSFVPAAEKGWKVWMLRTMLESFQGYGHPDDPSPIFNHPSIAQRPDNEYDVVIIGAGQSGLSLAGRLGALGIKYLLLEKAETIGYSWTGKYDSVRQHTVKEMNNLPFDRTYKKEDPILLPSKTVAEGFKNYVDKYKINISLGAQTQRAIRNDGGWALDVRVGEIELRLDASHLVLSMGAGVSVPNPPVVPCREDFKGNVLHQVGWKNALSWKGKKGIVVGTGTTAHDVAQDMLDSGLSSITMIQRDQTPVYPVEWIIQGQSSMSQRFLFFSHIEREKEMNIANRIKVVYNTEIPSPLADRLVSLIPLKIERQLMKANMDPLIASHSAQFDAVEKSGFKVDRKAVLTDLLLLRGGGYYIDVGTSKRIADGEIKVKSGVRIQKFTKKGLKFEDGEELEADLVVFATGYQRDPRRQAAGILGDEIAGSLPWYRGLDEEGEIRGDMRPSGE